MKTTFKYQEKIITTPNLEKKLKQMKLQLSDIEIIENKEKTSNDGIEDYMREKVIVRSTKDDIRRVCYVLKGTRPPFKKLFEKVIWNGKTGRKDITEETLKTMYYE